LFTFPLECLRRIAVCPIDTILAACLLPIEPYPITRNFMDVT
jgi:hypothetical protein